MVITCDGNIPSKYAHSINVMNMAQGFYENDRTVTLVTFSSLSNMYKKLKIGNVNSHYGVSEQIKIKYLPVFNKRFFFKTIGGETYCRKAARYINTLKPDFVYARSYYTPYYCIKQKIPTVIETHTTKLETRGLQKIYDVANSKYFLGLVTINKKLMHEHSKRGIPEEKILVLEDGVNLNNYDIDDDRYLWRKKLNLPLDKNLVVYCGHLHEEKGIESILSTAKELINDDVLFIMVGGWERDIARWKNYCYDKGIPNVIFVGFVPASQVPFYLKSSDVLIMAYKMDVNYKVMDIHTTSPLKLFEYMASRRPIVATDIPVVAKVITHEKDGLLVQPNDTRQYANCIRELLADSETTQQLADNAFQKVGQYSWKKRCSTILETLGIQ